MNSSVNILSSYSNLNSDNLFFFLNTLHKKYLSELKKLSVNLVSNKLDRNELNQEISFYRNKINFILKVSLLLEKEELLLNTKEEIELATIKNNIKKLNYLYTVVFKREILKTFKNKVNILELDKLSFNVLIKLGYLINKIQENNLLDSKNIETFLFRLIKDPQLNEVKVLDLNNILFWEFENNLSLDIKKNTLTLYLSWEKTFSEILSYLSKILYLKFLINSFKYEELEKYKTSNFLDYDFVNNLFRSFMIEKIIIINKLNITSNNFDSVKNTYNYANLLAYFSRIKNIFKLL